VVRPPPLGPGERIVASWSAELVPTDGSTARPGQLLVTTSHCRFFARAGPFGSRWETRPAFSVPLGAIRAVEGRSFAMSIGYGDRVAIPGVAIDGVAFRLARGDTPSQVGAAIASARGAAPS